MPDESALAKMLADALASVEDLSRRLAAAEGRAVHYERLAHQHEARLHNAADAWQTLERSLLHTRAELGRVLPAPPPAVESSSTPASTVSATTTPTTRTLPLGRVSTQVQLPPAKSLNFPTLPPPPVANPRNSQLLPPVNATLATAAPSVQPAASARSGSNTLSDRKERARFSDSPPPAAAPADSRKRKRDDDIDEELVAAVDGDSMSEMSLDDMILAASGDGPQANAQALLQPQVPAAAQPGTSSSAGTSPAPQPPRKKHAATTSVSSLPSTASTTSTSGTAAATQAQQQQALFPSHNAQGQRQCRACGQAGRYKDGKCVEKWGPGPAGPGTVCDRCRKKMKRVERRDQVAPTAAQQTAPQQPPQQQRAKETASPTLSSSLPIHAPPSPSSSAAAQSPNMRPATAETLPTLKPLARVAAHQLPSPPHSIDNELQPVPPPQRERGYYDAAREQRRVSAPEPERSLQTPRVSVERERDELASPPALHHSQASSHFGSSRRESPFPESHERDRDRDRDSSASHFGHSSSSNFTGYRSRELVPQAVPAASFSAISGLHGHRQQQQERPFVQLPRFAYEPPTSSLRSSGSWMGKHDEVEPVS